MKLKKINIQLNYQNYLQILVTGDGDFNSKSYVLGFYKSQI